MYRMSKEELRIYKETGKIDEDRNSVCVLEKKKEKVEPPYTDIQLNNMAGGRYGRFDKYAGKIPADDVVDTLEPEELPWDDIHAFLNTKVA